VTRRVVFAIYLAGVVLSLIYFIVLGLLQR
jgi:hypothetical protein